MLYLGIALTRSESQCETRRRRVSVSFSAYACTRRSLVVSGQRVASGVGVIFLTLVAEREKCACVVRLRRRRVFGHRTTGGQRTIGDGGSKVSVSTVFPARPLSQRGGYGSRYVSIGKRQFRSDSVTIVV